MVLNEFMDEFIAGHDIREVKLGGHSRVTVGMAQNDDIPLAVLNVHYFLPGSPLSCSFSMYAVPAWSQPTVD